jgi:hypothetical protein
VTDLLDEVSELSVPSARAVLSALMPLVKLVRSVRDTTILVLRKSLFARSTESKQERKKNSLNLPSILFKVLFI